jgi:hypothetical protein
VLTAKKGGILGVLAGKQGGGAGKKAFFSLFHFLVVFLVCKLLSVSLFRAICPCKKNRA